MRYNIFIFFFALTAAFIRKTVTQMIYKILNLLEYFVLLGADEKDQYKAYGKTFRKMIAECLQKEPSKRPTASELLKHPFFKKSKDRKYLTQTLLASGPSMETRVNKASKRQPGASGRLHRTVTGEWVWSSEEEDNGHSSDSDHEENRPMNRLIKIESSDSETEDQSELTIAASSVQLQSSSEVPPINLVSESYKYLPI